MIDKSFFKAMEKRANPIGLGVAALTAQGIMSDISANKSKVRLADPQMTAHDNGTQAYGYQFSNPFSSKTRSLYS